MGLFNTTAMTPPSQFTHYRNGIMDFATFEEVSTFLVRATGRSADCAKGLSLWADEVLVYRDARGAVCAAHGFKFTDVREFGAHYRLIFTVFSAMDARAGDRDAHLQRMAALLYARERLHTRQSPIVWVTTTSADPKVFAPRAPQPMHRAALESSSSLPQNTRVYTDRPDSSGIRYRVTTLVEKAIAAVIAQRNQTVLSAQMGETLLLPCVPSAAA